MALHRDFPKSPYDILDPNVRWFPADETLRETSAEKLMPPLVPELRKQVKAWRDKNYEGATTTSRNLLHWWFKTPHQMPLPDGTLSEFKYFYSQREALETVVYLHDVIRVKDKFDLMRFDTSGQINAQMFDETWRRFVIKMATGAGKTKVMSLVLAWSFFHKLYEPESTLSRNFLVIAPNIIVLDRIMKDFNGLKIFLKDDPVIPDNGFCGQNWRDDFQLSLHFQDDVHVTNPYGNIFLTNIHRVYSDNDVQASPDDLDTTDYFLGRRAKAETNDSMVDLGVIVRDIDELMVINDEAHHVHDKKLAWFKSIEDIHNRLTQRGKALSLQVDVTATPKHENGAIFVQTVSDYPLVEAIEQNVVKRPVLPDTPSRAKLKERQSAKFTQKYADYINLGVIEWRKAYAEHEKLNKKAIMFIMTDDTKNCDDVAEYLEGHYPELKGAVLVIHTKSNGEISEASSGKSADELQLLRKEANEIDSLDSPYKVIVSVMVLKEGWDVRNVTTIVGLRSYAAQNKILPEQTLGRGLRKMYPVGIEEYVSVLGTDAFMDFVESIKAEGVILDRRQMGEGSKPATPLTIEVDSENKSKDLGKLDIEIPVMTPRTYREYKNLADLDLKAAKFDRVPYKDFSAEEKREIVFKEMTDGEISHTTILDSAGEADYRSVIGYFTQTIMKELRLISGYDVLYGKVKEFVQDQLFEKSIQLDDQNTIRNLSEVAATRTLVETMKKLINELTIKDKGDAQISDRIKLRETRPFAAQDQGFLVPKKSVFNRIVGDSHLELEFAQFLESASCNDIISYAKNYLAVHFKLDYVNADGDISNYYPDFIVKVSSKQVVIVETKGQEDLDVPLKMARLAQWCADINRLQGSVNYDFVFVDEKGWKKYRPSNFKELTSTFREYKK